MRVFLCFFVIFKLEPRGIVLTELAIVLDFDKTKV